MRNPNLYDYLTELALARRKLKALKVFRGNLEEAAKLEGALDRYWFVIANLDMILNAENPKCEGT